MNRFRCPAAAVGAACLIAAIAATANAPPASEETMTTPADAPQKFAGLAPTPPMGWNSWNTFGVNIDEALIRETADILVASGMKDAGYQYVNLDDGWHGERDALGFIQPDPERFPSGMKALADYVHARGLKFGIYSDAGWKTCAGRPGSRGHEFQDALTYGRWDVDYLKYDWCYTDGLKAEGAYATMRNALRAAGRPILFSVCEWGTSKPWLWARYVGHCWRTTGDIGPVFEGFQDHGTWKSLGVLEILDRQEGLRPYAGPDHWNDPDMLEVGNGMTVHEDRAHFSMWCMLAAPLIAGNDLRTMAPETLEILTNREAIAVNQDPLGIQGFRHSAREDLEVWFKPLRDGDWAMCALNRGAAPRAFAFDWAGETVEDDLAKRSAAFADTVYRVRNLWTHQDAGTTAAPLRAEVPGHDVLMLRLRPR